MTKLHCLIRDHFRLSDDRQLIGGTTFAGDLEADSFDMVLFAVEIEEALGVKLADPFAEDFETIGDLETFLADKENMGAETEI